MKFHMKFVNSICAFQAKHSYHFTYLSEDKMVVSYVCYVLAFKANHQPTGRQSISQASLPLSRLLLPSLSLTESQWRGKKNPIIPLLKAMWMIGYVEDMVWCLLASCITQPPFCFRPIRHSPLSSSSLACSQLVLIIRCPFPQDPPHFTRVYKSVSPPSCSIYFQNN